jgi:diaminopimelate decarboxylase
MTARVSKPRHAAIRTLDSQDGQLLISGQPLTELYVQAGDRPCYLYDRQAISKQIDGLRTVMPDGVSLHYAIKANPHPDVIIFMRDLVDGFDVASGGELKLALAAGGNPRDISFAGPGKADWELAAAIEAGIVVHVESKGELARLADLAQAKGARPRVALRVNPDYQLKSSGMKMGGGPQQFGIDAEIVPAVLSDLSDLPVEFVGFHIFAGSQNLDAEAICSAQVQALELAERLATQAPAPVRLLNIGGGLGIPYFPGEESLDLAPIGASLQRIRAQASKSLPEAELIIFLVTDGGLHHHLAASGNFGQVLRKNYPVVIGTRMNADDTETASVVGPLCTPLDLLADNMELAVAGPGDLVVVLQSGAYGFTASPRSFLSHPEPGELFV